MSSLPWHVDLLIRLWFLSTLRIEISAAEVAGVCKKYCSRLTHVRARSLIALDLYRALPVVAPSGLVGRGLGAGGWGGRSKGQKAAEATWAVGVERLY